MWIKKILNEGKYSTSYGVFVRTFVISFHYGSGTVISNGSGSCSDFLTSYGSYGSGSTTLRIYADEVTRGGIHKEKKSIG